MRLKDHHIILYEAHMLTSNKRNRFMTFGEISPGLFSLYSRTADLEISLSVLADLQLVSR